MLRILIAQADIKDQYFENLDAIALWMIVKILYLLCARMRARARVYVTTKMIGDDLLVVNYSGRFISKRVQFEMKSLKVSKVSAICSRIQIARETDEHMFISSRDIESNSDVPTPEAMILLIGLDCRNSVTFVFVRRKVDSDHVLLSRQR